MAVHKQEYDINDYFHNVCYTDINECSDKLPPCLTNAICENTPGNFTCTCPEGYGGDGLMTPCLAIGKD